MIRKRPKKPIENHKTAAWANREKINQATNVSQPSLMQTINAKEHVDENEK
ncbi:MAG: DUF3787 domain-containing protein [Clostridiales bacterium]|jgi:hypothetical protein|nr:DUF3787 domain-containing protein [Clostridiales bacterium]